MKVKDKNLSEKEIDELVIAQANKENAWTDIQFVKNRAERGSREKFLQALSKVPKVEPTKAIKLTKSRTRRDSAESISRCLESE
ncbi:MAG: hypothetical protein WKF71_17205 [Pyrinomonadaceae bacterium]